MELRLPKEKLVRLKGEILEWNSKRSCTKRELQSITGLLQHAATVVHPGRTFIRRLYNLLSITHAHHHHIRLNVEARSDLAWWATFLEGWNGTSIMAADHSPQHLVVSDTSGHWGCGTYYRQQWFQMCWSDTALTEADIMVKDLYH